MKKSIVVVVLVLSVLLIGGCSSNAGNIESIETGQEGIGRLPKDARTDAQYIDDDEEDVDDGARQEMEEDLRKEKESFTEVSVEEQVLLDENNIVIILESIEVNRSSGPVLNVTIENKREEEVRVSTYECAVNNAMVSSNLWSEVLPGEKVTDRIYIFDKDLHRSGIETIRDIELKFKIDKGQSIENIFQTESIKIITSADRNFIQTFDDRGLEILNQDGVKIVYQGIERDERHEITDVWTYVENTTDKDIGVFVDDVTVNDFMIHGYISRAILKDKVAYCDLRFSNEDLDESDINQIEKLELIFVIYDLEEDERLFTSDIITTTFSKEFLNQ